MTDRHSVIAASRMPKPPARLWILGALLWGAASLASAADVTVQPASGSGFVVKDSGGATDRFRVQDNGQVSLPAVPAAATQAQSLCIAASGLLGPCAGGGSGSYSAGTGLSLTGSTFSVAAPYQLPQACGANQIPQWNGAAWICGNGGGGGSVGGSGIATYLPVWTGPTTLGTSVIQQTTYGLVGVDVNGLLQNTFQIGDPPSFNGNALAIGNGAQGMSFSLTPAAVTWYSNTSFSLRSTVGDALAGIGGIPTHNLDVFGGNAQIGLVNTSNSTSATISKYTNRLEISPVEAFQVSVGGLAHPHFWIGGNGNVGVGTTAPASKLQIGSVGASGYGGNDIAFGDGTQASGIKQTATVAQWYSTTNIALMPFGNGHGRVGINTVSPSYPLDVQDYVDFFDSDFFVFFNGDRNNLRQGAIMPQVSIAAAQNVFALEFDAYSDSRIKNIIGVSDSANDLNTINAFQVTDYTLKDKVRNGSKPFKKVIAQQVEKVYPQVVSQHVDFIPNVYRTASAVTKIAAGTLLHFDDAHGLSPGAKRLKLLTTGDHTMQQVGIVSIPSARDVVIDVAQLNGDKVFVYGEEVNDFRTVDYEGLTTLNISATQEIAKRLAKQQADLAALVVDKDAQLAEVREQLAKQQARVAELESLAADLSEIRAQLAAFKRNAAPAQWHDAALRP
jgi:Chaperone of endosialidase